MYYKIILTTDYYSRNDDVSDTDVQLKGYSTSQPLSLF